MGVRRVVAAVGLACLVIAVAGCDDDEDEPGQATAGVPSTTAEAGPTTAETPLVPVITIERPAEGASVAVPIAAGGSANTFEAALTVEVVDEAGTVLCARNIMATSGSGTPGTWETSLGVPPPDAETPAKVRAYELSAMDGSVINLVERRVTISTERPPLFITSPVCGASVEPGTTLPVEGAGLVFEAAFNIELRDASGTAVASGRGMAGGSEELPFDVVLALPVDLTIGQYDLVVFSYSARDGAIENEFSVPVIVEP